MFVLGLPELDVHFGEFNDVSVNWREMGFLDDDPDDEELETSPEDVVAVLGFDPKELSRPH